MAATLSAGALPAHAEPASAEPAHAGPARAEPLELRVRYAAPPACPTGADFLRVLQEHLAEGGDGAVDADVRITGPREGAFELKLGLRVGGQPSESQARAASCAALMQLAALSASMARTPAPAAVDTAAPVAFTPEPSLPELTASARGAEPDATEADGESVPVSGRQPATLSGFALAEVRAASGMLPGAAFGQGIGLGLMRGPWSLRLSGTWWLAAERVFSGDGGSPVSLELEQRSAELAPCAGQALSRVLRLEGCALLAVHGTETSAGERVVWAGLGGAALAALRPWRGLRLEAAAQLVVPLSAPSYALQTLEDVYRASAFQPGVRLAVGWEFGSSPRQAPARAFPPLTPVHARRDR